MSTYSLACPQCGFSRTVPVAKLPNKSCYVKCPTCEHRFLFDPQSLVGSVPLHPRKPAPISPPESKKNATVDRAAPVKRGKPVARTSRFGVGGVIALLIVLLGLVFGRIWVEGAATDLPFPYWLSTSDHGVAVLYGDEFYVVDYDGTVTGVQQLPGGTSPCQISWQGDEIWVSDWQKDTVLRYNGGLIDTIRFKGPKMTGHNNVAVDPANDRIYVTDSEASRIRVFDLEGTYIKSFGEAGLSAGKLFSPKDIAYVGNGRLVVGNTIINPGVDRFGTDGKYIETVTGPKAEPGNIFLTDFAIDSRNLATIECNLLVTDCVVATYDLDGELLAKMPHPPAVAAAGDVALRNGILYVSDALNRKVHTYKATTLESYGPLSVEIDALGADLNKKVALYQTLSKVFLVGMVLCLVAMLLIYNKSKKART